MAGRATRPRVLVVDDDRAFRAYVSEMLADAGFECACVDSADTALAAVREARPAAVLLDVCLPGLSGYEACRALREECGPEFPIIFVSGERTTPLDVSAGLLIGADDYVVKPFEPDELVARVRAAVRRAPQQRNGGAALTERELEVLRLLADGLGQQAIAAELVISPKTVGTHIEHILEKLGVHSRAEAVAAAYRSQLVARS